MITLSVNNKAKKTLPKATHETAVCNYSIFFRMSPWVLLCVMECHRSHASDKGGCCQLLLSEQQRHMASLNS